MRLFRILVAVMAMAFLVAAWCLYSIVGPATEGYQQTYCYVKAGANRDTVAGQLVSASQLSSTAWFDRVGRWLHLDKVKPGRYAIKPGMSVLQLVRMFRNGQQSYVKLSIVKERTLQELAGKIGSRTDTQFDSLSFLQFLRSPDSLAAYGLDTNTVLVLPMPFTYEISWAETPRQIMDRFHDRYRSYWSAENKAKAAAKGLTPIQASILASIVEEETNRQEDRYKIASTYLNRLRIGMKLQADPTVKYVTRNFSLNRIMYGHLALSSPYNTYQHAGLPPGPICTPSLRSLQAVLDAPATDYLFFVASYRFDGTTLFSSNYSNHQQYVKMFHAEQLKRAAR